jgi:hypothetical protein
MNLSCDIGSAEPLGQRKRHLREPIEEATYDEYPNQGCNVL